MKLFLMIIGGTLVSLFALGNTVNDSTATDLTGSVALQVVDYLADAIGTKLPITASQSWEVLPAIVVTQPAVIDTSFGVHDMDYADTISAPATDLLSVAKRQMITESTTDSMEWRGKQDAKIYFRRSEVAVAACLGTSAGILTG